MKYRCWVWILWPSFLAACMAEAMLFCFINPADIIIFGQPLEISQQAVYTLGFFTLWGITTLSSALTYLVSPNPQSRMDEESLI